MASWWWQEVGPSFSRTVGFGDSDFSLARYNADGSLDASFGSGGRVITDFTEDPNDPRKDRVNVLIRQPDGKLVAAGNSLRSESGVVEFGLAQYNLDGSLDGSFGSDGRVVTDFDGRFGVDFGPIDLVVQPGGKLIAGFGLLEGEVATFILTRFNADGSVDAAFGSSGFVVVSDVSGFRGIRPSDRASRRQACGSDGVRSFPGQWLSAHLGAL